MKRCSRCVQDLPITSFRLRTTKLLANGIRKSYYDKLCKECRKSSMKESGRCNCGQPLVIGKSGCERCLNATKVWAATTRKALRIAALEHYGELCVYCSEDFEPFLTIDHINNDGSKHRQEINGGKDRKSGGQSGAYLTRWLRDNKYPPGFQTLCSNCNLGKHKLGEHKLLLELAQRNRLSKTAMEKLKILNNNSRQISQV